MAQTSTQTKESDMTVVETECVAPKKSTLNFIRQFARTYAVVNVSHPELAGIILN